MASGDSTGASSGERWRGLAVDIRRAATPASREQLGMGSIEGLRLFERALRAGAVVEEALVARSLMQADRERVRRLLADLEAAGTAIVPAPDALVEELCEGRDSGRILGLVRLPSSPSLTELVGDPEKRTSRRPPCFLVLVDVEDPGNVGALVRTALASGADACVCVGKSDPWHPKAVRTSMGSVFRLPTPHIQSAAEVAPELARAGIRSFGAVSDAGKAPWEVPNDGPTAFLLGSEAFGLAPEVIAELDGTVTIPMPTAIDSFSVNAAAAILLYEAGRPRADGL